MEVFKEASVVRLRSHHDKYLHAEDDEETVSQERAGSVKNTRWEVEFVESSSTHIRLKSCYGKYLTASNLPFLLGMTGKKVLQTTPPKRMDSSVDWEPIQEGDYFKLKTRYGQYLRANGGLPPWRNHVTHDTPYRTSHQDWILWHVDVLRFRQQQLPQPPPPPPFLTQQVNNGNDSNASNFDPVSTSTFSFTPKYESDESIMETPKVFGGRVITYEVVNDNGEVDEKFGERTFTFKGSGIEELKEALKEESGLKEEFSLCSRNPLNGSLYPLRLQLPPNNAQMHVVVVPLSSKVADDLWL